MLVSHIVEVGLRDGLQNESIDLSLKNRYELVKKLSLAGLRRIELGSFVSPTALPQMKVTPQLAKKILLHQGKGLLPKNICYSAFVPNVIGFEKAIDCGLKEVAIFVSCTESFSKKNINMSVKESLKNLNTIGHRARSLKIKVRGYLSASFGCPYEGRVLPKRVAVLADQMMQEGIFELSLSDTIGVASFSDVVKVMNEVQKKVSVKKLALHFHNTRGMALANVVAGFQSGVRVFDSSIGGLGGCPYAPGASGNLATEDLVYLLEGMGVRTNVELQKLIRTTKFLEKQLKRSLPSNVSVAGLPKF